MSNDILLRHNIKTDRRERKNVAELRLIINPAEVTDKITDIHLYGKAKKIEKQNKKKKQKQKPRENVFTSCISLLFGSWSHSPEPTDLFSRFEEYSAVGITEFLRLFAEPLWYRNWATWDNHFRLNGQFQIQDYKTVSNEFRPFHFLWRDLGTVSWNKPNLKPRKTKPHIFTTFQFISKDRKDVHMKCAMKRGDRFKSLNSLDETDQKLSDTTL